MMGLAIDLYGRKGITTGEWLAECRIFSRSSSKMLREIHPAERAEFRMWRDKLVSIVLPDALSVLVITEKLKELIQVATGRDDPTGENPGRPQGMVDDALGKAIRKQHKAGAFDKRPIPWSKLYDKFPAKWKPGAIRSRVNRFLKSPECTKTPARKRT